MDKQILLFVYNLYFSREVNKKKEKFAEEIAERRREAQAAVSSMIDCVIFIIFLFHQKDNVHIHNSKIQ